MPAYRQESNPYDTIRLLHRRLTTRPDGLLFPMIQTLEAEIDETGSVRFNHPVHLDRKHRVLVMVMPDEVTCPVEETPEDWNRPHIDQPYRYLPSAS